MFQFKIVFIRKKYLLLITIKITSKVKGKILKHLTSLCIAQPHCFINSYLQIPVSAIHHDWVLFYLGWGGVGGVCVFVFLNKAWWRLGRGKPEIKENFTLQRLLKRIFTFIYKTARARVTGNKMGHRGGEKSKGELSPVTVNILPSGPIKSEHQEVWMGQGQKENY